MHRIGAVRECHKYVIANNGSFDTACLELYHDFKKRNGSTIVDLKNLETGAAIISEGATDGILRRIVQRMDELGRPAGVAAKPAEDPRAAERARRNAAAAALVRQTVRHVGS